MHTHKDKCSSYTFILRNTFISLRCHIWRQAWFAIINEDWLGNFQAAPFLIFLSACSFKHTNGLKERKTVRMKIRTPLHWPVKIFGNTLRSQSPEALFSHLRMMSLMFSSAFWVVVKIKREEIREYISIMINNQSMPTLNFCLWITYGSVLLWSNYLWGVVKSVYIFTYAGLSWSNMWRIWIY